MCDVGTGLSQWYKMLFRVVVDVIALLMCDVLTKAKKTGCVVALEESSLA